MQLAGLQIDIAGQDIVQNDVFNKVSAVILFIIILFDAGKGNRQQGCIFRGKFIGPLDKHRIIIFGMGAEGLKGVAVADEKVRRSQRIGRNQFHRFADSPQIAARNNHGRFIDDADGSVNHVTHLMDNTLKQPVGHTQFPSFEKF